MLAELLAAFVKLFDKEIETISVGLDRGITRDFVMTAVERVVSVFSIWHTAKRFWANRIIEMPKETQFDFGLAAWI